MQLALLEINNFRGVKKGTVAGGSAIGESVAVIPAPALPGWYVKRTSNNGIIAFNGKNSSQILWAYGTTLSDKFIRRISHQLDQRCRTVKPLAYPSAEKKRVEQRLT